MNYLTYSGNNLVNAKLPDDAKILYAPPPISGYSRDTFGRGQVILRDRESGVLWGGSDPRADGLAMSV